MNYSISVKLKKIEHDLQIALYEKNSQIQKESVESLFEHGAEIDSMLVTDYKSINQTIKRIDRLISYPLIWQKYPNFPYHSIKERWLLEGNLEGDKFDSKGTVNCVFIVDDNYVRVTAVAVNSIKKNRRASTKINVHIIYSSLSVSSCNVFKALAGENFSIFFHKVEQSLVDQLATLHKYVEGGYWVATPIALLKFFIPYILADLDRVLYLDGDVIVRGDLLELYQMSLGDNYIAAVTDLWTLTGRDPLIKKIGKQRFNSGVQLMNLNLMRKEKTPERLVEAKKNSTNFQLMDQLIFNQEFLGRVRLIDYKFNFLPVWWFQLAARKKDSNLFKNFESMFGRNLSLQTLKNEVVIAHFAGTDKPWVNRDILFSDDWNEYALDLDHTLHSNPNVTLPLVSIIIPVFNSEAYLDKCLESVCKQTLGNIEILCIDDGSMDSSPEILESWAQKDSRIRIFRQNNKGQASARNLGLQRALGKFIGFVDSDDYVEPEMFETMVKEAESNNYEIVECAAFVENLGNASESYVLGQQRSLTYPSWETNSYTKEIFEHFHACLWCKLYAASFLHKTGLFFDTDLRKGEDAVFQWCLMPHCSKYKRISRKLYHYVVGKTNSVESTISSEADWLAHIKGCKTIYLHWQKSKILDLNEDSLEILFNRFYKISKWRFGLCFPNASHSDFLNRLTEVFSCFTKSDLVCVIKNQPKDIQNNLKGLLSAFSPRFIVSLTSYPARIGFVDKTIESLIEQSERAHEIILWLSDSQFPNKEKDLPDDLLALRARGLRIEWTRDLKSYKKLVPSLKRYPEDVIITADDDILYPEWWLASLIKRHKESPKNIQVMRAHRVMFDEKFNLLPYNNWDKEIVNKPESFLNFLTGCAGCLYPPRSLDPEVIRDNIFMLLCPGQDDLWFWAMAIKANTKISVPREEFVLNFVPNSQVVALWKENVINGENDRSLSLLMSVYPDVLSKIQREYRLQQRIGNKTGKKKKEAVGRKRRLLDVITETIFKFSNTEQNKSLTILGIKFYELMRTRYTYSFRFCGIPIYVRHWEDFYITRQILNFKHRRLDQTGKLLQEFQILKNDISLLKMQLLNNQCNNANLFGRFDEKMSQNIAFLQKQITTAQVATMSLTKDMFDSNLLYLRDFSKKITKDHEKLCYELSRVVNENKILTAEVLSKLNVSISQREKDLHQLVKESEALIEAKSKDIISEIDSLSNFDQIENNVKQAFEQIADQGRELKSAVGSATQMLEKSKGQLDEILYAENFRAMINSSEWLLDKALNPGRWAIGFPAMYVLYRVLNETKPKSILELGLGQSTKIISQYADWHEGTNHYLVEHDKNWIAAFSKQFRLSKETHLINLDCNLSSFKNIEGVRCYENFAEEFKGRKFDLIFIDGPLGSDMKYFSRIDVISILPGCLDDNFVIMIDDSERIGEKNTIQEIEKILVANNIRYYKGVYKGIKDVVVIASETWRFSTSM